MNPLKPLFDYLEKARSHIYGIFIFWTIIGFAPVIFTILFVNQDLIYKEKHLLKGEYIRQLFFNFDHPVTRLYVIGVLAIAGLLTWLTIWKFPKWIVNRAYQEELKDYYARENMKLDEEDKLDKRRKELADKQIVTANKEETVLQKQEELESREEESWLNEYKSFRKTKLFNKFYLVPESIYEHYGRITETDDYGQSIIFSIPNDLLAYIDGNGLITLDVKDHRINLTKKGRFFLKNYQLDKSTD